MVVRETEHYNTAVSCEKDLRIQTGVLNRLWKEHSFYKSEADRLQSKVHQMREESACIHDVRHMSEVYVESVSMIPQVEGQILSVRVRLQEIVAKAKAGQSQSDSIAQLLLDADRLIEETRFLGTRESTRSSTASPPADDEPLNGSESSDDEY